MLAAALLLVSALSLLASCSVEEPRQARVKRLYKEEHVGRAILFTEYLVYYDAAFRVSRVCRQERREEDGRSQVLASDNHYYAYTADTLYLRCEGAGDGSGQSGPLWLCRMPLDEDGRVVSRVDPDSSGIWHYYYGNGALEGMSKTRLADSQVVAWYDFSWEGENLSSLSSEKMRLEFDYGQAPLDNSLNMDFLQFLLETTYMRQDLLWCLGFLGKANASLPSSMRVYPAETSVRFSYQTDGKKVVSLIVHSTATGLDEVWQVEYE